MLNSNKERASSRTSTLTFAVLFSVAGLCQPAAQAESISGRSFDDVFANPGRVDPTFMRPEVIEAIMSLPLLTPISPDGSAPEQGRVAPTFTCPEVISSLPPLPLASPDESTSEPRTTASTNPPEAPEIRGQPGKVAPTFTGPEAT